MEKKEIFVQLKRRMEIEKDKLINRSKIIVENYTKHSKILEMAYRLEN